MKLLYWADALCEIKLGWFLCVCGRDLFLRLFLVIFICIILSCVNNSCILLIGTTEKGSFNGNQTTSSNPEIKDIDSDKDPQSCRLYAPEMYHNFKVAEVCIIDSSL